MLAAARHSAWIGERIRLIHATGGAAANREILQVMADVFGAEVRRLVVGESAALGAALRARHGAERALGRDLPWAEVVAGFVEPAPELPIHPDPATAGVYARLRQRHAECEAEARRSKRLSRS